MSGWISIHRQLADHWLWTDKPFSRGQAWIDILMMVNHADTKILLGSDLVEIKRGSRITSIRQLCDRWGWSNTKVNSFLKLLEEDNMLVIKSDTKKTTLTVVNYSDYQHSKDSENITETSQKHHRNITETSQKHTNNNDNNDNTDNTDNKDNKESPSKTSPKFHEATIEYQLSESLYKKILINDNKAAEPNLHKWAENIDKLIRIDKRTVEEIELVINYVTTDSFEMTNVLSTSKLRTRFTQLYLKAKQGGSYGSTRNNVTDFKGKTENTDIAARAGVQSY